MSGIHVFDQSVDVCNAWIKILMERLGTNDPHRALQALRVTLHAIRDQLDVHQAAHLSAQLPMVIRGLFFDGWQPDGQRPQGGDFLGRIEAEFTGDKDIDAREVARAVVATLAEHISVGALGRTVHALPEEIRAIWVSETEVMRPASQQK